MMEIKPKCPFRCSVGMAVVWIQTIMLKQTIRFGAIDSQPKYEQKLALFWSCSLYSAFRLF